MGHGASSTYLDTIKSLLISFSAKVRTRIMCSECGQYRLVFARKMLSDAQQLLLKRAEEEVFYVCGTSVEEMFPTKSVKGGS